MDSPVLALRLRIANISSCLRSRLAFSMSSPMAISISSETWRTFSSDKCMGSGPVERGEPGATRYAAARPVGWAKQGRGSIPRSRVALVGWGPELFGNQGFGAPTGRWARPVAGGARKAGRNPRRSLGASAPFTIRGMRPGGPFAAPPNCGWLRLRTVQRSEVAVQKNSELRLRQGAHLAGDHRAVLEEHQRGDAPHGVLGGGGGVLVHVQLPDLEPPLVVAGDLVENRRDHLAGAAPFGPVVHEDRNVRLEHVLLERVVGYLLDCHCSSLECGRYPGTAIAARDGARSMPVIHPREVTTAASAPPALLECPRAGLPASRRGEPGQVRKEAAIVIHRGCRGPGSPTDAARRRRDGPGQAGSRTPRESLFVSLHGTSGTGSQMAPA